MKLCNLIPLGVKIHLKGIRTLLIAPKQGFWAQKSKMIIINISGVYEATSDVKNVSETSVDESLELVVVDLGHSPRF